MNGKVQGTVHKVRDFASIYFIGGTQSEPVICTATSSVKEEELQAPPPKKN